MPMFQLALCGAYQLANYSKELQAIALPIGTTFSSRLKAITNKYLTRF